jgi:hypothetical protein
MSQAAAEYLSCVEHTMGQSLQGSDQADRRDDAVQLVVKMFDRVDEAHRPALRAALLKAMFDPLMATGLVDAAGHPDQNVAVEAATRLSQHPALAPALEVAFGGNSAELKDNILGAANLAHGSTNYSSGELVNLNKRLKEMYDAPAAWSLLQFRGSESNDTQRLVDDLLQRAKAGEVPPE